MRTRLPSGLTVITEENHAAPVAALQVWVRVGSADERPDEAGLAHLHEHMLFKGTGRRGPGEIARQIEGAGGEINAWTSFDQTVYHVVVAQQFLEQGMDVLADALTDALFDPAELAREIEVVCEEIKRSEDSPSRKLSKALFAASFAKHPYGKPVIGTEESVRSFARDGILQFYRRHYRPQNCTLVAVGDFAEARVVELAGKLFRFRDEGAAPFPSLRATEEPRSQPSVRLLRDDVKEGYLSIAWPAPSLSDPDAPAMDALSIVLGHGEASRLYRALKRDRLLCTEAHASCYTPNDPGLTLVGLTLQPETLREAVAEALRQTYRLRSEEVTPEELELACRLLESDAVYQRETVQGQARKLGYFETGAGGLEFEEEYYARIAALTPAKLRAVAERRIDPRQAVLAALLPQTSKDGIDVDVLRALLDDAAEVAHRAVRQRPSPSESAAPRASLRVAGSGKVGPLLRHELPGGGILLVKEERGVPLVSLRAVWPGGLRAEDESTAGINMLLARLATQGTKHRGGEQLSREMEAMGGAISGNSGRNSFGMRAELLSKHLPQGLALFAEVLGEPAFPEREVHREVALQLSDLRTRDDNPSGVCFQLFGETLYQRHPYRLDVLGNESALASVTPASLQAFRERHYAPSSAVLAVVGDVDPAEVHAQVIDLFAKFAKSARPPLLSPPAEPPLAGPRTAVRRLDKAQAHLVLGFPGLRLNDPLRWPLEVLSAVLSGQGGRLFVDLRDQRSLAYTVTSFSIEGVDPGYFAVYIACSPHKTREALAGIREHLYRLHDSQITEDELDRARTHLVGTHAIGLQRNSARAAVYAFDECYGMGADASLRYPEQILAVTASQVQECARRLIDAKREVIALVAPEGVEL